MKKFISYVKRLNRPKGETEKILKRKNHIEKRISSYSDKYRKYELNKKIRARLAKGMDHLIQMADENIHKLYIISGAKETFDYFILSHYEYLADLCIDSNLGFTDELYDYSNSTYINRLKLEMIEMQECVKMESYTGEEIFLYFSPNEKRKIRKLIDDFISIEKEYYMI